MKHFIKKLTLKITSTNANEITSRFSPILLTSLQLSIMLTLMVLTLPSFAAQTDNAKSIDNTDIIQSYSSGQLARATNKTSKEEILKNIRQRVLMADSDQEKNKALSTTRDEVITQKHQQALKSITANLSKNISTNKVGMSSINTTSRSFSDGSFVIYEGYSQLIEDIDGDGYYQTFSVTFDADLITGYAHDEAVVYAELYLSENGGPWAHYYTTDNFIIHGESSDDEFEVYSTLAQGFNANQYDVLIDLYEEGYPNIVASYSSDDTNSLYALPLESSDYDVEYIEYYSEEHIHGGSSSLIFLLMLGVFMLMRQSYSKSHNH